MERTNFTPFVAYHYARRAAVGQLAAQASSASAALAASAAPTPYTLSMLGRRASQHGPDTTLKAAA